MKDTIIKKIIKWGLILTKWTLFLVTIGIVGALLWDIWMMSEGWSYFFRYFQSHFNLNIWLIRIITLIFVVVFLVYVLPNIYQILNPFKSQKKKRISVLIIVAFLCILWFATYMAEKDSNFDATGRSLTCKAWAIDHYEDVACHFSVHPVYGTPVIKVTKENISIFSLKKIVVDENTVFFNPVDGTPLVYYYQMGSKIDFFNSRGIHPQYGEELLPVTRDFVKRYFQQIETDKKKAQDELIRQNELERQKEIEKEKEVVKQSELERQREIEKEKEIAKQNELERQREIEKEKEIARQAEQTILLGYLYVFPEDLGKLTYKEAIEMCRNVNSVNSYGYRDWRLPTLNELKIIYQNRGKVEGLTSDYYISSEYFEYIDTLPSASFDGIVFDTYPLNESERSCNCFSFIPKAKYLLSPNGFLTYYSDETKNFRVEHLQLLLANYKHINLNRVSGLVPSNNCEYWNKDYMIIPTVSKPIFDIEK